MLPINSNNPPKFQTMTIPKWLFDTKEDYGESKAIAQDIVQGRAIAVSDGSYDTETGKGASSSIFTNKPTYNANQLPL